MGTLVSIGHSCDPFPRLLNEIARLAANRELPMPVMVQHGHTPFSSPDCIAIPILQRDEFARRLAEAELVITHAGAGTLLQALEAGKHPVVVPRRACYGELVDDHQTELAHYPGLHGRIEVVDEVRNLSNAIREALAHGNQRIASQDVRPRSLVRLVTKTLQSWAGA